MYVKTLSIENFRCFSSAKVSLNYPGQIPKSGERLPQRYDNVTLFIGPNGSGKTSVFKALCLAVLAPVIGSGGLRINYFVRRPVGYIGGNGLANAGGMPLGNCNVIADLEIDQNDLLGAPAPEGRMIGQAIIRSVGDTESLTTAFNNESSWLPIYSGDNPAFFLAAYGSNRRSANPEGYAERQRSTRYQRVASIFEEYAGLVPFNFGRSELLRLNRLDSAVRILNDLLPENVQLTDALDHEGNPLFNSSGVLHPFASLSDGYRGFVAWVWDLMVQMARCIPPAPEGLDLDCLSGVVIVDEIDLFLHPRWQRFLIEELAKQFPRIQFLFSTHSPIVVGMLEAANLRVLTHIDGVATIEEYEEEVSGKTTNQLLRSVYFGLTSTRSPLNGTISEQAEQELKNIDFVGSEPLRYVSPIDGDNLRKLDRFMAQGLQFEKAKSRAEKEASKKG